MTETVCGECGEVYPTEEQATRCANADLAPRRALPWRKCHPMCDRSAWDCWRDNSWWHTNLMSGWPWPWRRGFPGPLYWLCPDCRALHKDLSTPTDGDYGPVPDPGEEVHDE
jgi:hypothetical protein